MNSFSKFIQIRGIQYTLFLAIIFTQCERNKTADVSPVSKESLVVSASFAAEVAKVNYALTESK